MRISDWSSDVCSSDLVDHGAAEVHVVDRRPELGHLLQAGGKQRHLRLLEFAAQARVEDRIADRCRRRPTVSPALRQAGMVVQDPTSVAEDDLGVLVRLVLVRSAERPVGEESGRTYSSLWPAIVQKNSSYP